MHHIAPWVLLSDAFGPLNELISAALVTSLRQRMIDDMNMRHFGRETRRNYITAASLSQKPFSAASSFAGSTIR
jgi:hypothetical protein